MARDPSSSDPAQPAPRGSADTGYDPVELARLLAMAFTAGELDHLAVDLDAEP
ncbi:MAG: hypothetical protein JRI23_34830, partial [Deltaproteobacteria bacterium]|nr:hypothetical protein [Deltaproteobacteria bacterium]MBW2537482.1 hypothetical protein [Deltaproteobacteria bacterium]